MTSTEIIKRTFYDDTILNNILQNQLVNCFPRAYREFSLLNYVKKTLNKKELLINRITEEKKKIAFRCITFNNLYYFKKTLEYLNFFTNDSNMYCSVARINFLRAFPFYNDRTAQTKPFFEKEYVSNIVNYDLYLDLDIDSMSKIPLLVKKLCVLIELILKYNIESEIVFSGSRGFKVLIYNYDYGIEKTTKILYNIHKKILNNSPILDLSGIGIPSKLMKCTNSLVFKGDSIKVALALNINNYEEILEHILKHNDFSYFDYDNFKDKQILKKIILGFPKRFNVNTHYQKTAFKKFVSDYHLLSKMED